MNSDDKYIADCEALRGMFRLQLHIVMATDIPNSVKNKRIEAITQEIITLKNAILAELGERRG